MSVAHNINARTEDGESLEFQCRQDEDVISAALRQEIILMASCREGSCATCKATCPEGLYELGSCSVQALAPDEEEEGVVLLCQTYPETDLEVELPYTYDRVAFGSVRRDIEVSIDSVEQLSSNVVSLKISLTKNQSISSQDIGFLAGQYFDIQIPGTDIWRSFSPANVPANDNYMEFLIRMLPDGKFTNYLREDAYSGQLLKIRGPFGSFYLRDEESDTPRYFLAGGTGLAPVVSMVRQIKLDGEKNRDTRLYFGVTNQDELFYTKELEQLKYDIANLTVKVAVWKPDETWDGEKGNVVELLKHDLENGNNGQAKPELYLCGPPGMMDATYEACLELGIPKDSIHTEKFLPAGSD